MTTFEKKTVRAGAPAGILQGCVESRLVVGPAAIVVHALPLRHHVVAKVIERFLPPTATDAAAAAAAGCEADAARAFCSKVGDHGVVATLGEAAAAADGQGWAAAACAGTVNAV